MKILLLCRALSVGGVERQIVVLAKSLRQRGADVSVAVFYADGQLQKELYGSGVPVLDLRKSGRWDLLSFLSRSIRTVRQLQPQVIYGFLNTPNILTVFLKLIFPGIKIVWGVRASNVDLDRYDWLFRLSYRVECRLAQFADLIICNSRAGLEYAAAHGFPRKKMVSIPNGIDTERFRLDAAGRARVRQDWRVGEGEILIGLVARLDPMKDHPTFLRAAATLTSQRRDVRFVCVGDGAPSYRSELQNLANELGLEGRITWAGERNDMPEVFSALDVAVSSSYGEGFSNTIAEAMACGVPCVVTDVGDSALIVGAAGEVVPPSMPDALCQGLRRMLDRLGPELRLRARTLIVDQFTNDVLVTDTMDAICAMK